MLAPYKIHTIIKLQIGLLIALFFKSTVFIQMCQRNLTTMWRFCWVKGA